MAAQDESPFPVSWPGIIALLVAVWGLLAAHPRLDSPRPPSDLTPPKTSPDNSVPARLWQDPLSATENIADRLGPLAALVKDMPAPSAKDKEEKRDAVLLLFDCLDPETSAEAIEVRRRERYTTLTALSTAGYAPTQPDRIYCARYSGSPSRVSTKGAPREGGNDIGQRRESDMRIPYEWARPVRSELSGPQARPEYLAVCVLWVNPLPDSSSQLGFLHSLKAALEKERARLPGQTAPKFQFAITGRIGSSQLDTIVKGEAGAALDDVTLYVTNSTAPFVRTRPADKSGPRLEYVIDTDDRLADALVGELRRRGIDPGRDPVAVIAEWDTSYGRNMPDYFDTATASGGGAGDHPVHHYSYLRGLDGKLPGRRPDGDSKEGSGPDGTAPDGGAGRAADQPTAKEGEGERQFDYLRRLADRMKLDQRQFKAIGVVGSDVYDKLLLLQALRPRFPNAVFFTTDLDVRLLQPGDYGDTRNLLIAAHYGLALNEELQDKVAPFRSSYDTASYLGTLRAVKYPRLSDGGPYADLVRPGEPEAGKDFNGDRLVPKGRKSQGMPVHLYEVGRSGAYELTLFRADEDTVGQKNPRLTPWVWQGNRPGQLLFVLAVFGFLVYPVSRSWQRFLRAARDRGVTLVGRRKEAAESRRPAGVNSFYVLAAVAIVAAVGLTALMFVSHTTQDQEPFELLEGLSVWPTVVLRLLAVGLCAYYVLAARVALDRRNARVARLFSFPAADGSGYRAGLGGLAVALGAWRWEPAGAGGVAALYSEYQAHGEFWRRAWRAGLTALFNLLLFMLLWWLFAPTIIQPRGPIARSCHFTVIAVALVTLAGLLMFVVDSTLLSYRFVTALLRQGERRRDWPAPLLCEAAKRWGLALPGGGGPADPDAVAARRAVGQWLVISLIDEVTYVVAGRLIYCPFVVLLVLIVAQNRLFNDWHWNVPLALIALFNAGAAVVCALLLQHAAKRARGRALEVLGDLERARPAGTADALREKLGAIKAEVGAVNTGAFASFSQNPIVGAVLLPLGGGGGLAALEALLAYLH